MSHLSQQNSESEQELKFVGSCASLLSNPSICVCVFVPVAPVSASLSVSHSLSLNGASSNCSSPQMEEILNTHTTEPLSTKLWPWLADFTNSHTDTHTHIEFGGRKKQKHTLFFECSFVTGGCNITSACS